MKYHRITAEDLAILIRRHLEADAEGYALILGALATRVREDFSRHATDDACDSLDMASDHIAKLREFTHEERQAHTLAHYSEMLAEAQREAA